MHINIVPISHFLELINIDRLPLFFFFFFIFYSVDLLGVLVFLILIVLACRLMVLKISSKFELRRFCRTTGAVAMVTVQGLDNLWALFF
jgi:hypothetical protein